MLLPNQEHLSRFGFVLRIRFNRGSSCRSLNHSCPGNILCHLSSPFLGGRVFQNVMVRDLDLAEPQPVDGRRPEMVVDGLPTVRWMPARGMPPSSALSSATVLRTRELRTLKAWSLREPHGRSGLSRNWLGTKENSFGCCGHRGPRVRRDEIIFVPVGQSSRSSGNSTHEVMR